MVRGDEFNKQYTGRVIFIVFSTIFVIVCVLLVLKKNSFDVNICFDLLKG